jgi:hypothetical protein
MQTKISVLIPDLLARLPQGAALLDPPVKACPALRADETECRDGCHVLADAPRTIRPCRLRRYREERARLAAQLQACGVAADLDAMKIDLGGVLLRQLDRARGVTQLGDLVQVLSGALGRDLRGGPHLALLGDCGTGKTHALLALHFGALWRGVRSLYLTSGVLRDLAAARAAYDEIERANAEQRLRGWQGAELLLLDDLGDRASSLGSREAGSSHVAAVLLDLLNGTMARIAWSSNLQLGALEQHPDIGKRAVSRLTADRMGLPCELLDLRGADQRQHALRRAHGQSR